MEAIEDFFKDYKVAAMNGDVCEVSRFYAESFIAAGKRDNMVFQNDGKFIDWLEQVFRFNRAVGLQNMEVCKVSHIGLGEHFFMVTVTWSVVFAIKPLDKINFDIHYILRQTGNEFKIILYISEEDQEELMKEKGVL